MGKHDILTRFDKQSALDVLTENKCVRCVKIKHNRGSGAFLPDGSRSENRGEVAAIISTEKGVLTWFGDET